MGEDIQQLMIQMVTKYPTAMAFLSVMAILRAVNKPLFAFLRSYVLATETKKDDAILDKVEQSKVYSYFCFVLDWLASIKIGPQAK